VIVLEVLLLLASRIVLPIRLFSRFAWQNAQSGVLEPLAQVETMATISKTVWKVVQRTNMQTVLAAGRARTKTYMMMSDMPVSSTPWPLQMQRHSAMLDWA